MKGELDMGAAESAVSRASFRLTESGQPAIALRVQRPEAGASGDVVYVHGGTFGADQSIFVRIDGRSWADALNDIGRTVWGFDFAGYGRSDRYPVDGGRPAGRMDDVIPQLRRVIAAVRASNGERPVSLIAHSWGGSVAARYGGLHPEEVKALVLFAPIVTRAPSAGRASSPALPSHFPLTLWAQYRRFVEDVPRGEPQVMSEAHFQAWGEAFLGSDPHAKDRVPSSVLTPGGPLADIGAMWAGNVLYESSRVVAPTLLVRGAWDSLCTDADAQRLLAELGAAVKRDVKIERATHLMHLESQRTVLHDRVNGFLKEAAQ
jgi:pimeloyl-ACP methyl ester carboxylesterase